MKRLKQFGVLISVLLLAGFSANAGPGHSYSSGGGHSYSSHSSSSHSSSSGGSHSYSSGGGRSSSPSRSSSSGGSSKSFTSSSGKSYGASSKSANDGRHGYTSTKSYSSGDHTFASSNSKGSPSSPGQPPRDTRPSSSGPAPSDARGPAKSGSSDFTFDSAAARARKEQARKEEFPRFKENQASSASSARPGAGSSYSAKPPPVPASDNYGYKRTVYVPNTVVIQTRPRRIYDFYSPYWSRPVIYYHDPYNSFFWWWLLDRTLDEQAYWAYHHRYDMDPARYEALLARDQQLE